MGRPPKKAGQRLSKNRTFRVRGDLDQKLLAAAATANRSVSEEIEHRLELSFVLQKTHEQNLQQVTDARMRTEDLLHTANNRIEELELRLLNNAIDIENAITKAFEKAGIKKRGTD